MTQDNDKPPLNKDDADLWQSVTQDVQRLPEHTTYREEDQTKTTAYTPKRTADSYPHQHRNIDTSAPAQHCNKAYKKNVKPNGLDHRTDQRLRRGQINIDARIDLHGMNQIEAYEALDHFIQNSYTRKRRCVLVITGKGRGGAGVLRARVPQWLNEKHLHNLIIQTHSAQPRDGGEGALYILLKRHRE